MSTTLSCPRCGAAMRHGQDWCQLCYSKREPMFDPLTAPLAEVLQQSDLPEELDRDGGEELAESRVLESSDQNGMTRDAAIPAADEVTVEVSDVDVMLSMLAAEHRRADPTTGLANHLEDKSTRVLVMIGGSALVTVLGFAMLVLLGALF